MGKEQVKAVLDRVLTWPRERQEDAAKVLMLMESQDESLYRLTDLETRLSLNLNVLDATRTPMVMGLHELLSNWLAHQIDILQRRSRHRLQKIADHDARPARDLRQLGRETLEELDQFRMTPVAVAR